MLGKIYRNLSQIKEKNLLLASGWRTASPRVVLFALAAALLLPVPAQAAKPQAAKPELRKVFVYAGKDKIRLVALFAGTLPAKRLSLRLQNGGLAVFVPGVRGGKPHRRFAVGQGGYRHIDTREAKGGLWLHLSGNRKFSTIPAGVEVSVSGSAVALTLPVMSRGGSGQVATLRGVELSMPARAVFTPRTVSTRGPFSKTYASPRGRKAGAAKGRLASPDEILSRLISPRTAEAASFAQKSRNKGSAPKAAPVSRKNFRQQVPEKSQATSRKTNFVLRPGQPEAKNRFLAEANTPSYTNLLFGTGGVLGLIVGSFMLFRRFGAGAAGGFKGNGRLIRTLHRSYIAPKQSLALVEVAGEVLVLGLSGQNISMLTKLEDTSALEQLRGGGEKSFVDHLQNFMKKAEAESAPQLPAAAQKKQAVQKSKIPAVAGKVTSALLAYAQGRGTEKPALGPKPVAGPKPALGPKAPRRAAVPAAAGGEKTGGSLRLKERLKRIEGALAT